MAATDPNDVVKGSCEEECCSGEYEKTEKTEEPVEQDYCCSRSNVIKRDNAEITCKDFVIEVVLNGEKVNSIELAKFTQPNKRPDGSSHKFDVAYRDHPKLGYIGLQDHGSPCWFKNIKLKPLN